MDSLLLREEWQGLGTLISRIDYEDDDDEDEDRAEFLLTLLGEVRGFHIRAVKLAGAADWKSEI